MNQLDYTLPNGYPDSTETQKFRDDAFRDSFAAVVASLSPAAPATGAIILQGCEVDFGTRAVSAGWVVINGEIRKVLAHTAPIGIASGTAFWIARDAFDAVLDPTPNADPLTPGTKNVHQVRDAILGFDPGSGTRVAFTATPRHPFIFKNEDWVTVGAGGAPAFLSSFTAGTPGLQYRRDALGNVHLRGQAIAPAFGSAGFQSVFILPIGYHQGVQQLFSVHSSTPGTADYFKIQVTSGGIVQASPESAVIAGKLIPFDGIILAR
jgi:hypothetical protein